MKSYITFLVFFLIIGITPSIAQQKIIFTDGEELLVKITEISDKTISYKTQDNLNGPLYIRDKKDVSKILFEDGREQEFQSIQKITPGNYLPNIINFHVLDIAFNDFTFSYERIFAKGNFSFQIPFGFGYEPGNASAYEYKENTFYSGFALFYYPFNQHKWTYYFGPEFRFGYVKDTYIDYFYDISGFPYEDVVELRSNYAKMIIRNGVKFSPVASLSLSANFGIGIKHYAVEKSFRPMAHGAINIAYHF